MNSRIFKNTHIYLIILLFLLFQERQLNIGLEILSLNINFLVALPRFRQFLFFYLLISFVSLAQHRFFFWIIGQSTTSFLYIYNNKKRINFDSISDIIFILLSGFCFLSSTYSYFIEFAFYKFDNISKELAIYHILFIGIFLVFLDLINRLTRKISFFYEALNELGLKLEEIAKRIERKL
jgi:hypothetical protein